MFTNNSTITTPEEDSYILGILQGDGSSSEQSRNRGRIVLELNSRDLDILTKIQAIVQREYNCTLNHRERATNFTNGVSVKFSRIGIHDQEFRELIKPYLPVGKKSSDITPPANEPWFDLWGYLRGVFDADGSIGISSKDKPFWSLCTSSTDVRDIFIKAMKDTLGVDKHVNRNTRDRVYNICLFDEDAVEFSSKMYEDASIWLDRKHNKFVSELLTWKRTTSKRKGRRKPWTELDDKILNCAEYSIEEKMKLLNRSAKSIQSRWYKNKNNKN